MRKIPIMQVERFRGSGLPHITVTVLHLSLKNLLRGDPSRDRKGRLVSMF